MTQPLPVIAVLAPLCAYTEKAAPLRRATLTADGRAMAHEGVLIVPWCQPTHAQRMQSHSPAPARQTTAAVRIRNSHRWQRFREWFRRRYPLCCDPFGHHAEDGVIEATDHVHHIIGLEERSDLAFDDRNCAPLCTACHARVEAMERRGEPTVHLFKEWQGEVDGNEPSVTL